MIPVAEARELVLGSCRVLEPVEVDAGNAFGLVLAGSLSAPEDVPPFDNSAMDGYAVRSADTEPAPSRLRVVGTLMAGDRPTARVGEGEAVRIMTGAPLPPGADAVCMVELTRTEESGSTVMVEPHIEQGTNVRRAGSDIPAGAELFEPGTLLGAPHLGVLASLGVRSVTVHPRPRVGVLSTGDELDDSPGKLEMGKIRDSNRPSLLAQLRADSFDAVDLGVVNDDEGALSAVLEQAATECDALVSSGGVSVGDRDVVRIVLEKLGGDEMRWMQVAVKPAKPFAFGRLGPSLTPIFGLPGNPVSALVSYELFVRPYLLRMAGHRRIGRPRVSAVAEADLRRERDGKLHLVRVVVSAGEDGVLRATPSGGQGSHMLHAMADANALALLPDGDGVAAGGRVELLLLDAERLAPIGVHESW
ncbi:MAG TPA: gephyrin-like molybdotransferase Glp [Acidimicrobiales bacterium]|nr:gephyrin-like molybdotransferase Glp [Acidimicrobiales bacterium]